MALYNLIQSSSGDVVNVFDWDGISEIFVPTGYYTSSHTSEVVATTNEVYNQQFGGDFYGNFFLNGKNLTEILGGLAKRREVKIATSSGNYELPDWTKEVTIIAIGGGGAGGGGVRMYTTHSISLGAAGGSGGAVAYRTIKFDGEIDSTTGIKMDTSKDAWKPFVSVLIGPEAQGGDYYVGTASYSSISTTSTQENFHPLNVEYYYARDYFYLNELITGSRGGYGSTTSAWFVFKPSGSSGTSWRDGNAVVNTQAAGGPGGFGGVSLKIKSTLLTHSNSNVRQAAWDDWYSDVNRIPLTKPGGSNHLSQFNVGDVIISGGPGGCGIDYFAPSGSKTHIGDFIVQTVDATLPRTQVTKYSNNAPSLPWGLVNKKTSEYTPRPNPAGVLSLPWGYLDENKRNANMSEPNGPVAPGGGGGGTGYRSVALDTIESAEFQNIGRGGIQAGEPKLFSGVNVGVGGDGGNLNAGTYTQVVNPTTGSSYGCGGGGGASCDEYSSPQAGANGKPGVVYIICEGENLTSLFNVDVPPDINGGSIFNRIELER